MNFTHQKISASQNQFIFSSKNIYVSSENILNKNIYQESEYNCTMESQNKIKSQAKIYNSFDASELQSKTNEEDLDIELNATSLKIPIDTFYDQKPKKSKIRRAISTNNLISNYDNDFQNIDNNYMNIENNQIIDEFNATKIESISNRKNIISQNEVEDNIKKFEKTFTKNNDVIETHNKLLNKNDSNDYDYLLNEIKKLKKQNHGLIIKNNQLTKLVNKNGNKKLNNDNKEVILHRENLLMQKIKKLENELLKQKELVTKLTYNKRFNIGIRKIRTISFIINSNTINNKLKKKNSIKNFNLNLKPNKTNIFKKINKSNSVVGKTKKNNSFSKINFRNKNKIYENQPINFKKVITNNNYNKYVNKSVEDEGITDFDNSIINKSNINKQKNEFNNSQVSYRCKKMKTDKYYFKNEKIEEKKDNDENCIDKGKLKKSKTNGKISLIMTVLNDNLLGNFNLVKNENKYKTRYVSSFINSKKLQVKK